MSADERERKLYSFKKLVNKKLRGIGLRLGFDKALNLSIARSSFATKLKLDGVPVSFISDTMGAYF
jgi:hypothetical protein